MKNLKLAILFVLGFAFVAIAILGFAGIPFFQSNIGLEIIELVLGLGGLVVAFGKWTK